MTTDNDPSTSSSDMSDVDVLSESKDSTGNSNSTMDMDDTTGSNGGSTEDRFSGEEDDRGDSPENPLARPNQPRTNSAQVDHQETSGSTGDSATAQSAGRSQY